MNIFNNHTFSCFYLRDIVYRLTFVIHIFIQISIDITSNDQFSKHVSRVFRMRRQNDILSIYSIILYENETLSSSHKLYLIERKLWINDNIIRYLISVDNKKWRSMHFFWKNYKRWLNFNLTLYIYFFLFISFCWRIDFFSTRT